MTPATEPVRVYSTAQEAADACAAYILEALANALAERPAATLAISGGSTPRLLFSTLAKSNFDWSRVHLFWVDERCVPPDSDQSNFRLANETLIQPARLAAKNVHRIQGELRPEEGATEYAGEIAKFFSLSGGALPVFDVIHRGIGPDAHTASLFPGEPLIADRSGVAASVWVEKMKSHRVTLLPGVLIAARKTVVQAAGADKAEPIFQVLRGEEDFFAYPCQIATRGSGTAVWFLDPAAAAKL